MIRRALTAVAVTAAIVAVPGAASAHPSPDPTVPYCGPGMTWVGVNGDANGCARTVLGRDQLDDSGIFAAIGGAFAAAWLLL